MYLSQRMRGKRHCLSCIKNIKNFFYCLTFTTSEDLNLFSMGVFLSHKSSHMDFVKYCVQTVKLKRNRKFNGSVSQKCKIHLNISRGGIINFEQMLKALLTYRSFISTITRNNSLMIFVSKDSSQSYSISQEKSYILWHFASFALLIQAVSGSHQPMFTNDRCATYKCPRSFLLKNHGRPWMAEWMRPANFSKMLIEKIRYQHQILYMLRMAIK